MAEVVWLVSISGKQESVMVLVGLRYLAMGVRVVLQLVVGVVIVNGQTDKRCFLEGGWSTISFFVREDLDVNSVIGKIRAIGEERL